MTEILQEKKYQGVGFQDTKSQIILTHTSRPFQNFIKSLEVRNFGNYKKIPNYIISKDGQVHKLLEDKEYSSIFKQENINKNSIVISLENLGWLVKEPLKDYYVNWIGDIYKGKVFERKWRDYFFWDPYTKSQFETTFELCKDLCQKMSINLVFVGHNTKINYTEKIKGIVTRSNFDVNHTDLSPAFDFENFTKKTENV